MALTYLFDTNICIYIAKQKPLHLYTKFEELKIGEACMSIITFSELCYGVEKSRHHTKNKTVLDKLTSLIPPLPFPIDAGRHYGQIRSKLERKGLAIGNNDLWIAAHALSLNIILVTNNVNEFKRIPSLQLENWTDPNL